MHGLLDRPAQLTNLPISAAISLLTPIHSGSTDISRRRTLLRSRCEIRLESSHDEIVSGHADSIARAINVANAQPNNQRVANVDPIFTRVHRRNAFRLASTSRRCLPMSSFRPA
jgi:hypothetical protein